MKSLVILTTAAGLLTWGGCKSPALNSSLSSQTPAELNNREQTGPETIANDLSGRSADSITLSSNEAQNSSNLSPKAIEVNLRLGRLEDRTGNFEKAKRYFNRVLSSDPENVTAHHRLAVIADKQRDFAAAEKHYLAAQRNNPSDPELLADIGYSYFLQNEFQESEAWLNSALQNDPAHQRTLSNLGLLYATMGDYNRALAVLSRTGTEAEARQKLAKLFPGGVPQTSPNGNPPTTVASSSSAVYQSDAFGSQQPLRSNPPAANSQSAADLMAPDPRQGDAQNSTATNPRVRRFMSRRDSLSDDNFASTEYGNFPNEQTTVASNSSYPSNPGITGEPNGSLRRTDIPPYDPGRPLQRQPLPYQSQPAGNPVPRPVPIDVWPAQEQSAVPTTQSPASSGAVQPEQFSNPESAAIQQPEPWNDNLAVPDSQIQIQHFETRNPNSGNYGGNALVPQPQTPAVSPEEARQATILGMNTGPGTMLPAINPKLPPPSRGFGSASPHGSITISPAQSQQQRQQHYHHHHHLQQQQQQQQYYSQSGAVNPALHPNNPVTPQTADVPPGANIPQWRAGQLYSAGNSVPQIPSNQTAQPEAFRLYEQRLNNRDPAGMTVQRLPQTVPQQQKPSTIPAWRQYPHQYPSGEYAPQIGMQPGAQGVANGGTLR